MFGASRRMLRRVGGSYVSSSVQEDVMQAKSLSWVQPACYGAACGAIALAIVGFHWGGWVTGGTAQAMASSQAQTEVVAVLTPLCLNLAKSDPAFSTKMIELKKASS